MNVFIPNRSHVSHFLFPVLYIEYSPSFLHPLLTPSKAIHTPSHPPYPTNPLLSHYSIMIAYYWWWPLPLFIDLTLVFWDYLTHTNMNVLYLRFFQFNFLQQTKQKSSAPFLLSLELQSERLSWRGLDKPSQFFEKVPPDGVNLKDYIR